MATNRNPKRSVLSQLLNFARLIRRRDDPEESAAALVYEIQFSKEIEQMDSAAPVQEQAPVERG